MSAATSSRLAHRDPRRRIVVISIAAAIGAVMSVLWLVGAEELVIAGQAMLLTAAGVLLVSQRQSMGMVRQRLQRMDRRVRGRPLLRQNTTRDDQRETVANIIQNIDRSIYSDRRGKVTLDQLAQSVAALSARVAAVNSSIHDELAYRDRRAVNELSMIYRQLESLNHVTRMMPIGQVLPPLRDWNMSPDLVLHLVRLLTARKPALLLELGAGSSTVWLAAAIKNLALTTRIVSIDHDSDHVGNLRALLHESELDSIAEIRTCHLAEVMVADESWPWYSMDALRDVRDVGILIVTGPPSSVGPLARYPALPVLLNGLAKEATVILDNSIQPDEPEIVRRWVRLHRGITTERLPYEGAPTQLSMPRLAVET